MMKNNILHQTSAILTIKGLQSGNSQEICENCENTWSLKHHNFSLSYDIDVIFF